MNEYKAIVKKDFEDWKHQKGCQGTKILNEKLGKQYFHTANPHYFAGKLDAEIVLVQLNSKRNQPDFAQPCLFNNFDEYFEREVLPFASDAWYDKTKMKLGYEISFTKYFCKYEPQRDLVNIELDIMQLVKETDDLPKEIPETIEEESFEDLEEELSVAAEGAPEVVMN